MKPSLMQQTNLGKPTFADSQLHAENPTTKSQSARANDASEGSRLPSMDSSSLSSLQSRLLENGFLEDDPRFVHIYHPQHYHASGIPRSHIFAASDGVAYSVAEAEAILKGPLEIPSFQRFKRGVQRIFEDIANSNFAGKVASYIPQLASADPTLFGVSFCSIDGQRFSLGDSTTDFCMQSCVKPVTYSIALEELGEEVVHSHIGREPSGKSFNHLSLLDLPKIPHNPMINAGAIMSASLVGRNLPAYQRFGRVQN
ncbi:glutaminase-domain-containing protein, partial [Chytriomyces sp. MP71]